MTSDRTSTFTSSPESGAGPSPSSSPDGPTTGLFGPEAVPASRSRRQGSGRGTKTSGTCGPSCSGLSASVALASSLASRLRQRLGTDGSMEYSQTWREKATPAGRSYWAHTASARRTYDSGCTGWPSHRTSDTNGAGLHGEGGMDLRTAATLAGWATPAANEYEPADVERMMNRRQECKDKHGNGNGFGMTLGQQVTLSPAETGSTAASRLNSRFSLWLQGFPPDEWASCGERAMPSSRRSPPSS
mgnify:CR=1 FL=1